jgi:hypothetical protein
MPVRKQMQDTEFNRQLEQAYQSTETFIKGTMTSSFVVNMFFAGSLSYIISMMNSL